MFPRCLFILVVGFLLPWHVQGQWTSQPRVLLSPVPQRLAHQTNDAFTISSITAATESKQTVLALRGGGGAGGSETSQTTATTTHTASNRVAQFATGVSFLHGVFTYADPAETWKVYTSHNEAPSSLTLLTYMVLRRIGFILLCYGIVGYAVLFPQDVLTCEHAVGLIWLGWVIEFLRSILSKELQTMGAKNAVHALYAIVAAILAGGIFLAKDYSPLFTRVSVAFFALNALVCMVFPMFWRKLWQLPMEDSKDANSMLVDFGCWASALAVFLVSLVYFEKDPMQAYTYSRLVVLARSLLVYLGSEMFQRKPSYQLFWLVYHLLVVIGLGLDTKSSSTIGDAPDA